MCTNPIIKLHKLHLVNGRYVLMFLYRMKMKKILTLEVKVICIKGNVTLATVVVDFSVTRNADKVQIP